MDKKVRWLLAGLICVLMGLTSCGGDDNDGPTTPSAPANVNGPWYFSGQLTKNTCQLNASQTFTGTITFNQSGSSVSTQRVNFNSGLYFSYRGTVAGNSVSMAAMDPYVEQSGGTIIHFGSGIDVQNIKNNSGDGSINLTGACVQGCSGTCQTIWTGTWTKQ